MKAQFSADEIGGFLQKIDADLATEGYTIPQRPMNAVVRIGQLLKLSMPFTDPRGFQHESSENWYITQCIHKWYENRYENRVKQDFSPGLVAIDIRNDVYIVSLPLIFGSVHFYSSAETVNNAKRQFSHGPIAYNVLDAIPDLTPSLRAELTREELHYIHSLFELGIELAQLFRFISPKEDIASIARSDIDTAVNHLSDLRREYALSKWSSLQATEKVLKYVISKQGGSFKQTHDLSALLSTVRSLGVHVDIDDAIKVIQCSAGIRYGQEKIDERAALDAHHGCLFACRELLHLLSETKKNDASQARGVN
mgnify:CR=1 FL=1